jgi:hypothetical protein
MNSKIYCIKKLIFELKNSRRPADIIPLYHGLDWQKYVTYGNNKLLWSNNYLELYITGLKKDQYLIRNINYSQICSKVLEGEIKYNSKIVKLDETVIISPFSNNKIIANIDSVSLDLHQSSYMN